MSKAIKGYVYVIQDEIGRVKVGITTKPCKRISAIRTGCGMEIVRQYVSQETHLYTTVEMIVFEMLKDKRGIGEWFTASFEEAKTAVISTIDEISK